MIFSNKALFFFLLILSRLLMADYVCNISTEHYINHRNEMLKKSVYNYLDTLVTILHGYGAKTLTQKLNLPLSFRLNSLSEETIFHIQFEVTITNEGNSLSFDYTLMENSKEELNLFITNNNIEHTHFKYCLNQWLSKLFSSYQYSNSRTDL